MKEKPVHLQFLIIIVSRLRVITLTIYYERYHCIRSKVIKPLYHAKSWQLLPLSLTSRLFANKFGSARVASRQVSNSRVMYALTLVHKYLEVFFFTCLF